ncbi:hypothetical protein BJ138DRAFT_1113071 [Hygrophoropsis aurantiaca]|uniref:Uncharacterized protein n=1 Tax=Hygrophoropsis aurantiaca TaxID=72124 RepID=A0ACB8ADU9_9AGAM|nr:hypothetical protein BJ138DRAFT_1113071 [Hygrophoropsis aurantiaca]
MLDTDVAKDYGALLLGGLLAFGLSGCVNMQIIVYWRLYSSESWRTKSLVMATWFLDIFHSVFVCIALWDSIIVPYGDLSKIDVIPWSVGPAVELTAMVTFLVQSFFSYRIYRLNKKKWTVAGPIAFLAFFRLVAASVGVHAGIGALSLGGYRDNDVPLLLSAAKPHFDIKFSLSSDFLRDEANEFVLSAQWTVMPQNRIFLGLHFVVGKLYANSLLATLNARNHIRKSRYGPSSSSVPMPIMFPDNIHLDDAERREGCRRESFRRNGVLQAAMRLDPITMRAGDLKGAPIQVSIERTVESKFDCEDIEEIEEGSPPSLRAHDRSDGSDDTV